MENEQLEGSVNLAAPNPARNRDFTAAMGKAVRRPAVLPAPGFVLRASDATREMLMFSQRVVPAKLAKVGFEFRYPELEAALNEVFG